MNDLTTIINSKLGNDLLNKGKLPPVEVEIKKESILLLSVSIVVVCLVVILALKISK